MISISCFYFNSNLFSNYKILFSNRSCITSKAFFCYSLLFSIEFYILTSIFSQLALNSCKARSFRFRELIHILKCYSAIKFSSNKSFFFGNSFINNDSIKLSSIYLRIYCYNFELRLGCSFQSFLSTSNTYASLECPLKLFTNFIIDFSALLETISSGYNKKE